MSKAASRYRLYKMLLEMNLTSRQREKLLSEAGLFDKLKGALGQLLGSPEAAADLPKAVAGDKAFAEALKDIKGPFKDGVKELNAIAKEHDVDPKELINYVINNLLEEMNIDPKAVADPPAPSGGEGKGKGESGGEAPAPGKPISANDPEAATAALQQAVADATGAKPEAVAEKADDIDKATDLMGKLIAKNAKVDAGKATLVIKGLIELGKLKMEGHHARKGDVILASRMLRESAALQSRWLKLSGLLKEEGPTSATADAKAVAGDKQKAKGGEEPAGAKLTDWLKSLTPEKVKANPPTDADKVSQYMTSDKIGVDKNSLVSFEAEVKAKVEELAKNPDSKEAAAAIAGAYKKITGKELKVAGAEETPAAQKEAVKKAKENFGSALSALNKKLKDKVDVGTIGAVLIALDDSGVIEVEKG